MDEHELIAVGVAGQVIHGTRQAPESNAAMTIPEQRMGGPRRCHRLTLHRAPGQLVEIERVRTQRSFETAPARRWMTMMKECSRAEETLFAHLALERTRRQIGVGLPTGVSRDVGIADVLLHSNPRSNLDCGCLAALKSTPRRIWSSSSDSNKALKLPSPKPSLPLRWMISKKQGRPRSA